jgi:hypothetical protein
MRNGIAFLLRDQLEFSRKRQGVRWGTMLLLTWCLEHNHATGDWATRSDTTLLALL